MAGDEVTVREATSADRDPVLNVLDAAMLETDAVPEDVGAGDVLVAVEADRVLGALVLVGDRIDAVAVRRSRRARGIGTLLVDAAIDRVGHVTATFDAEIRPFYRSLDFEIERIGPDRFRGERDRDRTRK